MVHCWAQRKVKIIAVNCIQLVEGGGGGLRVPQGSVLATMLAKIIDR